MLARVKFQNQLAELHLADATAAIASVSRGMTPGMPEQRFDAVVIGAGPGGYPAAIRLGQLKVKTAIIEREYIGGVCLNVGCIPSKALIHAVEDVREDGPRRRHRHLDPGQADARHEEAADLEGRRRQQADRRRPHAAQGQRRRDHRRHREARRSGPGRPSDHGQTKPATQTIIAKNIVLATGSRPIEIPGFKFDSKRIIDSTGALALDAGAAAHDRHRRRLHRARARHGLREARQQGHRRRGAAAPARRRWTRTASRSSSASSKDGRRGPRPTPRRRAGKRRATARCSPSSSRTARPRRSTPTRSCLSVGRRPNSENLGLDEAGVTVDKRGFVDRRRSPAHQRPRHLRDRRLIGGMMLAHKATKEGEVVAEVIAGHKAAIDVRTIPAVVFTDPGDRDDRPHRGRGEGQGPHRAQGRQVPVRRARPRAGGQRDRRLRQGRRRRQDRRAARRPHRRQRRRAT